jgi:hypothetical protein
MVSFALYGKGAVVVPPLNARTGSSLCCQQPCQVLRGMANMQEPAASILRVGHLFAEGAVNTLVVCLNTRLYDITSWNPVISKPFHYASLPEDQK